MYFKSFLFFLALVSIAFFQACTPDNMPGEISKPPVLQRLTKVSGRAPAWNWAKPEKPLLMSTAKPDYVYQVELQDINKNALVLFRNDSYSYTLDNPGSGRLEFFGGGFVSSDQSYPDEILVNVTLRNDEIVISEMFPLKVSRTSEREWDKFDLHLTDMTGPFECEFRVVLSDSDGNRNDLYCVIGSPVFIPESSTSMPNVVIISLDSLRSDDLGCYGSPLANSPTMDMLSREGVLFSKSLSSSSWTVPGVKNFLYGRYSWFDQAEIDPIPKLSDDTDPMIQEVFAEAGYYTAAVMGNPLVAPNLGFERGFDLFDMYAVRTWYEGAVNETFERITYTIENYNDRPLFLYIHIMDPHDPYLPSDPFSQMNDPPPDQKVRQFLHSKLTGQFNAPDIQEKYFPLTDIENQYIRSYYRSSIREVDALLHLTLKSLYTHTDFPEDTIVLITSDHGEEFGEHGYYQHGFSLYENSVRIPWIMSYPLNVSKNRIIDGWVSSIDIPATLSELVFQNSDTEWEGQVVYPEIPGFLASRNVFTAVRSLDEPSIPRTRWRSIYRGNRKLMWSPSKISGYNLADHPEEQSLFQYDNFDTFKTHTTDSKWLQMGEDLQDFMNRFSVQEQREMSDVLRMQLRELGYIQ